MCKKIFEKIFGFLTKSTFGLLLLVNLFFFAGIFAGVGWLIGGLIWIVVNIFIIMSPKSFYDKVFERKEGGDTIIDDKGDEYNKPKEKQEV